LPLNSVLQAFAAQFSPSPLQRIHDPEFARHGVELWIKRDDLLHPIVSGNKWRKLKYSLNHALQIGVDTVVSMGGAYSNHLHALAFASQQLKLKSIGLVRGERPAHSNPTLDDLAQWGMTLRFVSRSDYRQLRNFRSHNDLPGLQAGEYWLPEGGASELALRGIGEIIAEIDMDFDHLLVACGTGATLAGLVAAAPEKWGIAALKGAQFLVDEVNRLLRHGKSGYVNWHILLDYHHGGFAKTSPVLLSFMESFRQQYSLALDPVYTGKMAFAAYAMLEQGCFQAGQRVVLLHTGGLQGTRA